MMVNAEGKGSALASTSSPKIVTAETALTETTMSSPMQKNQEDIVVVSETEEHAIEEEMNGENAIEEEEKNEENAIEKENNEEDAMEEEKVEENTREKQKEDNGKASSKDKVRKPRKRSRRKKVARGGSKTEATKDEDNLESSGKTKVLKKVESMGMIFMCSSKTKKDCYRYKVFGLPGSKKDLVQKVYKGMRLFLYDIDLRLMYGIYKAAGPGGFNIEPKAFNSAFPSQVRFTVAEDCLPLAEEKFKKVISDNYYSSNKFDCQLTSKQVKDLCKLFADASKGSKSKKVDRGLRAAHTSVDRGRIRRQARDERRPSALGREPRYPGRPVTYERGVFAYPMAPLHHVQTLPPPVIAPSYAYGRTLEMDPYIQDEIGRRDHSLSYIEREPASYRLDTMYSAGLRPEYHHPAAEYRSAPGLRPEYRSAGTLPEYHTRPTVYRL